MSSKAVAPKAVETMPVVQQPPGDLITKEQFQTNLEESGVSVMDVIHPKILLMQSVSAMVGDGKAKLGDVIHSHTLEVIGNFEKSVEIVPLWMFKTFRVMDATQKPAKLKRVEHAMEGERRDYEAKDPVDGKVILNVLTYNFFALLKSELDAGEASPVIIEFKSSGRRAGEVLNSQLFKLAALNRKPYTHTALISVEKRKKDTNTYGAFNYAKGTPLSPEHQAVAALWTSRLDALRKNKQAIKTATDDSADVEDSGPGGSPAAPAPTVVGSTVVGSTGGVGEF